MGTNKITVYSAITGGKDAPRDDVLTFSEYDKFTDPRMNAKIYKVLSHLFVETEYSIWVDGNLTLNVSPEQLVEEMGDRDIAVFANPYRDCIYEEAEVCKELGFDAETIDEQMQRYRDGGHPEHGGLGACFLIVRRHTDRICQLNERWWAEICRGSVRDQLSFPVVFGDVVDYLEAQPPKNNKYFTRKGHIK